MLGESLGNHVRRLRLERAAWRLKLTDMPVVQIALEAGYETHETFTRAFRRNFGMSPTQFRKRNGVSPRIHMFSGVHYHRNARLKTFRADQNKDKSMNVSIQHLKPARVAFMRHIGPYNQVGKTWERLMMLTGKEGLLAGDVRFIGICHDDPAVTPPKKIRYDACITVDEKFRPHDEIGVQVIAGGDYALLTHFGPYEKLGESYAKLLGQWLPRSGRRLRHTPCFDVYLNSPENTESEELITDIYAPLEKK
jgi:AraC family transcriptional regulator